MGYMDPNIKLGWYGVVARYEEAGGLCGKLPTSHKIKNKDVRIHDEILLDIRHWDLCDQIL
jgi:hypothetical protein